MQEVIGSNPLSSTSLTTKTCGQNAAGFFVALLSGRQAPPRAIVRPALLRGPGFGVPASASPLRRAGFWRAFLWRAGHGSARVSRRACPFCFSRSHGVTETRRSGQFSVFGVASRGWESAGARLRAFCRPSAAGGLRAAAPGHFRTRLACGSCGFKTRSSYSYSAVLRGAKPETPGGRIARC